MRPKTPLRVTVLGLMLATAACALSTGSQESEQDPASQLEGQRFIVTALDSPDRSVVQRTSMSFMLRAGELSIQGGCNSMRGTARLEGSSLIVDALSSSYVECEPEVMTQEAWLRTFLTSRPIVSQLRNSLILSLPSARLTLKADAGRDDAVP